jgi:hypothetical protein
VADYACVGSGHHLTHIEKIVSGMFLRRTDFQDLQRMVVSCISDTDAEIALTAERRKIASWPDHYGAYTRAMEEAGPMAEVLERETRLTAIEAELGRIHARVLRLLAHLEGDDAENRRQRARQAAEAHTEEQAHRQTAEGIRFRQEAAAAEARTALFQGFEPRLNALDTEARTNLAGLSTYLLVSSSASPQGLRTGTARPRTITGSGLPAGAADRAARRILRSNPGRQSAQRCGTRAGPGSRRSLGPPGAGFDGHLPPCCARVGRRVA